MNMNFKQLFNKLILEPNPNMEFNELPRMADILLFKDFIRQSAECKLSNDVTSIYLLNPRNYDFYLKIFKEKFDDFIPITDYRKRSIPIYPSFKGRSSIYLVIYLFIGNF